MTEFNPFAESKGFERELTPQGIHLARCARVIEIGKQESPNPAYGTKDKVVVVFSLSNLFMELSGEQKQKFISKPFGITISNNEKSDLKEIAMALSPEGGGSFADFLDKPCQLIVGHEQKGDRTIEKIKSIAPVLPGTEVPPLDTEPFWFPWNKPNPDYWVMIPKFTQDLIKQAVNYPGSYVEEMVLGLEEGQDEQVDDLPF